ncbi:MAG TPA: phosphoribosylaminoimidazolesuccinocarboxamide synthase [Amycolatopsis sp.]|jgi:phosphoribosylaminoimidazole-succinocarboxamide synthase|nr:phosphoribosylaminoimidazolesuccinocarboxamide synthase [Amycolatopsis sp.]
MKRWSSKDLEILAPPADGKTGEGIFTFSDRYSVFDFGIMPDEIPGKGAAATAMAVKSFALFAAAGIETHFLEQVADNAIRVRLLDVDLDGRADRTGAGGMIPLQVVYRAALPRESSVHRRLAAGRLDPGLVPAWSTAGRPWLGETMVEFTTKFEETDRFVTREEAAVVGRVSAADLDEVIATTRRVTRVLARHCAAVGLELVDGKAEYGFDGHRGLILIDHAGTPDENRFYRDGIPVCKELLRFLHPGLREVVQAGVRQGLPRDRWPRPDPLAPDVVAATSTVYRALAAVWTQGSPAALDTLSTAVRDFLDATGAHLSERTGL